MPSDPATTFHKANFFYTTTTDDTRDLDPVAQVLSRRIIQVRRAIMRKPEKEELFRNIITMYAGKHGSGESWPQWYQHQEEGSCAKATRYPIPQPHPTTKHHDDQWDSEIDAYGPIGLMIQAIIWNGLVIDSQFRVWQPDEEPINILRMSYQHLKQHTNMMAARARSQAEWIQNEATIRVKEIDRQASQVCGKITDETTGFTRTIMMGGGIAKEEISKYNQDIDSTCDYCKEEVASIDHIIFICKHFQSTRKETDKLVSQVPLKYLLACIRCGIAPAI